MPFAGLTEQQRLEMEASTLKEMELLAARIRELVAAQPPRDLLGYIYAQRLLGGLQYTDLTSADQSNKSEPQGNLIDDTQFVLEYVHAVLASTPEQDDLTLDEAACAEIFDCAAKLRPVALLHAMVSSGGTEDGAFGPKTADVEARAKFAWIQLRGNRYQVLEGEFYAFVLAPHDEMLRKTYGMGASEIAAGFQDMANAVRTGQAKAAKEMAQRIDAAHTYADAQGKVFDEVAARWVEEHADDVKATAAAFDDMLRGGICNVSRHTNLPATLLEDLSFARGEETEFFAEGPYCGTPLRALPARKKPLIRLGNDFYAVDPCFTRDAGYRALLHNLLERRPDYKKEFTARQKAMSEAAFFRIFDAQLRGAKVNQEVFYKDPATRQWVENDTLIRIDDMLLLVEAKAGAAATIASPAVDFPRHVRAIQELVVKAYAQCKRFFDYLNSAEEVPIFERKGGNYVECDRIRLADYRLLLPIGLTVESFSPFSTMCKELPGIEPLLGRYPFLSLSIDDLFVLKRFLPTMGELAHYLEVRQSVAGMRGVHLFDEVDHLGAYIERNRFDQAIEDQRAKGNAALVIWDGMSAVVDRHFEGEDWETRPVPTQDYPSELLGLLGALDRTRAPGWLAAESVIRSYGEDGRNALAGALETCRVTLSEFPSRYFQLDGQPPLFVWLQRVGTFQDRQVVRTKAIAAALAANVTDIVVVVAVVDPLKGYVAAERYSVEIPSERTPENAVIFEEAYRVRARQVPAATLTHVRKAAPARLPGRNKPCWCGSGIKYKKCHGR